MLNTETAITKFIALFRRPEGEYANHYTTDVNIYIQQNIYLTICMCQYRIVWREYANHYTTNVIVNIYIYNIICIWQYVCGNTELYDVSTLTITPPM